jgi:biofilm protein TabA
MILADFNDISQQAMLTPNMEKAIDFLRRTDLTSLPEGRVAIDGDEVYAIVSVYTTKPLDRLVELEGHKKYVDIQLLLAGREVIGWASAKALPVTVPYDEDKDFWNGNLAIEQLTFLRLAAGQAAVFYPSDAHAPQAADGEPTPVKKIVVKVALL